MGMNLAQQRFKSYCKTETIKTVALTSLLLKVAPREYRLLAKQYNLTQCMVAIHGGNITTCYGYCIGSSKIIRLFVEPGHYKFKETLLHETAHLITTNGHSKEWLEVCKLVLDNSIIKEYKRRYAHEIGGYYG